MFFVRLFILRLFYFASLATIFLIGLLSLACFKWATTYFKYNLQLVSLESVLLTHHSILSLTPEAMLCVKMK